MDRRTFTRTLASGALASLVRPSLGSATPLSPVWNRTPDHLRRAEAALAPNRVTGIRILYPPNSNRNNVAATFNQSNMLILVDTEQGITGIGEGGSPDLVRALSRSVIGKNAYNTEQIWQYMYMDAFYSPGREKVHALGAIDMALWDIKAKALNTPLYNLFGGTVREHVELYSTSGMPNGLVSQEERSRMSLREMAAATMEAGWRVFRVDGQGTGGYTFGGALQNRTWDARKQVRAIGEAAREIREGVGLDGNWMIDLHQKFDFSEALEACKLMEEFRPYVVEDPLREEQFRTQIPLLRMLTTVPLGPGEEWGQRWEFNTLVEQRHIDWARATLPNVGGVTEMLKIMALCDTHRVGIIPHFTGPVSSAAHLHTMMAFPGQVLMEFNITSAPNYVPEFMELRNGKLWPNERPGLGITLDESLLTLVETFTEGGPGPAGNTYRRLDGSPTHW